ncbi:hypothetical protein BD769DRAFT_1586904, partial [Suillus cothurnatus]
MFCGSYVVCDCVSSFVCITSLRSYAFPLCTCRSSWFFSCVTSAPHDWFYPQHFVSFVSNNDSSC